MIASTRSLHPNDRPLYGTFRDDEAPSETEPLEPSDAPDHTDDSPQASGRDRAASLEVIQFVAGSAVLIAAILYCNHLSHVLYPN